MNYAKEIFKAYDIRGIVETQLTLDVVHNIGKVLGTLAIEAKAPGLVVGFDGRLSSPELAKQLIDGILKSGCNVYEIGEVTTPMVYFANYKLNTLSGVMITGSHNPPEYNGLKMVIGGKTLARDDIQDILHRLQTGKYNDNSEAIHHVHDIAEEYIERITSDVTLKRPISIIIDCGNGVAGSIAPKLYRRLNAKVLGLYCDVDGNFPNHHPDPSKPENLKDLIDALAHSDAELGLAFDGDGDRLGVVTSNGEVIYPDRQMMLYAADILRENPGAKILYDVKSSGLLAKWIKDHGGEAIMCQTGHSLVKAKIKDTGALLAGEMSGHIFFNDRWYGADDGVYAGARLLEILSQVSDPSALLNALPNAVSTPEININVAEGQQHTIVAEIQKTAKFPRSQEVITIDGVRVEYTDGFGLVRASNTTPVLVLRFESETLEGLNRIKDEFRDILNKYIKNVNF
jgi:phosphomannomutase / phosphoglucomutase